MAVIVFSTHDNRFGTTKNRRMWFEIRCHIFHQYIYDAFGDVWWWRP